jgi:CRISPR-associated protein Csy2
MNETIHHYLLLPRMDIQRANALVTAGIISVTPVLPAVLMGEAFGFVTGITPTGVMLVHHDAYLLAEHDLDHTRNYTEYFPHNIRTATVFNRLDIAGSGSTIPSNAHQPSVTMNGTWSVVFEFTDLDPEHGDQLTHASHIFLEQYARLAGGVVINHQTPVSATDLHEVMQHCRNGFVTVDRSHWLSNKAEPRIATLFRLTDGTEQPEFDGRKPWLLPSSLGYALLTNPKDTEGSREGYQHCFAETLLGLIELVSLRNTTVHPHTEENTAHLPIEECFWRYSWPTDDAFVIKQENVNYVG